MSELAWRLKVSDIRLTVQPRVISQKFDMQVNYVDKDDCLCGMIVRIISLIYNKVRNVNSEDEEVTIVVRDNFSNACMEIVGRKGDFIYASNNLDDMVCYGMFLIFSTFKKDATITEMEKDRFLESKEALEGGYFYELNRV